MEGLYMTPTAVGQFKIALAREAYGIELRLWKESGEREWGASLRDEGTIVDCHFEEDNLTLAQLRILGEARKRVISRSGSAELPVCDTFLGSWKPVKMAKS
jgi:hypothetical protein